MVATYAAALAVCVASLAIGQLEVPYDTGERTTEDITEEIVRTLASSIGLVLAVPLTTAIATLVTPGPIAYQDKESL